jgi:hypothetical protein
VILPGADTDKRKEILTMELDEIMERMHTGQLYVSNDSFLMKVQREALNKLYDYNNTRST